MSAPSLTECVCLMSCSLCEINCWTHRAWPWRKRLRAFSIFPNYLSVSAWALPTLLPATKWPDSRNSRQPAVPWPPTSSTRTPLWLLITTATRRVKRVNVGRAQTTDGAKQPAGSLLVSLCRNWSDIMNYSQFSAHTDITSIKLQRRPRQPAPQMSRLLGKMQGCYPSEAMRKLAILPLSFHLNKWLNHTNDWQ